MNTVSVAAPDRRTIGGGHPPADSVEIRVHAVLPRSRANGPGTRMVIWFQGCTLSCPGCFNPLTHPRSAGRTVPVSQLLKQVVDAAGEIEGVTVSGGEPLEQPAGLEALLRGIREKTRLSVLLFSGYTLREIERMPLGPSILALADILVAGRYVESLRDNRGWRGSSNQEVCFLTPRYRPDDLSRLPGAEVRIGAGGTVQMTGIRALDIVPISKGKKRSGQS